MKTIFQKLSGEIILPMKTSLYTTFVFLTAILFTISCQKENEKTLAVIVTLEATNITSTTALSGGTISDDGGSLITGRGICWNKTLNPTILDSKTINGRGKSSFISSLTGLIPGEKYYARAYAINSIGTAYGTLITFTTTSSLPVITTTEISGITATSATCNVNITSDGGSAITARGVCWSTSQNPTTNNSKTNNGMGTGTFISNITGLAQGTTYYVRAYATNSYGTVYGNQISFTTSAIVPTVTTTTASSVTSSTSVSGGNITSDGGTSIIAKGVCWSTSQNPTTSNSKTSNGSGIGSFVSSITGLTPATNYYVRAYATNSVGTAYGNQINFITLISGNSNTVTTLIIDTLELSPIIVGGIVTSDESSTFTERGILYGLSPNLTVSNSTLVGSFQYGLSSGGFDTPSTSNGKITSGSGKGSFSSTIKHLLGSRTYYVRAYAINSKGVFYGEILKFNTKNYTRDPRRFDISNVFWTSSFTLFDVQTDEIILPNSSGNFDIFCASNENPRVYQVTRTPSSLSDLGLYKFKTKENCQLWCDIKNGVLKP